MWREQHTEYLEGIPLSLFFWNLPTLFFKNIIAWGKVKPFCSQSCRSSGAKSASQLRHIPKNMLDLFSGCSQKQRDAYFGCSTVLWQQTNICRVSVFFYFSVFLKGTYVYFLPQIQEHSYDNILHILIFPDGRAYLTPYPSQSHRQCTRQVSSSI